MQTQTAIRRQSAWHALRAGTPQLHRLCAQAVLLATLMPTAIRRLSASCAQRALMQLRWQLPVLPVLQASMMRMRRVVAAL